MLRRIGAAQSENTAEPLKALIDVVRHADTPTRALHVLGDLLAADGALLDGLAQHISTLIDEREAHVLLAETGVLAANSVAREALRRLAAKLLPDASDPSSMSDLLETLFHSASDADWLALVPIEAWARIIAQVLAASAFSSGHAESRLQLTSAISLLATRLAGIGLGPVVMHNAAHARIVDSPFLQLINCVAVWVKAVAEIEQADEAHEAHLSSARNAVLQVISTCEATLVPLRENSRLLGTSVAFIHALQALRSGCARLRMLLLLASAPSTADRALRLATLLDSTVRYECNSNSLRQLARSTTDDLALQMTEHASKTGEHYVTDNRSQWLSMFRAAAGAGVIVAFMALLKINISAANWAPLWSTLAVCLNYALGFVLVHLLHMTVATKQPAMTAALLAARLEADDGTPLALGSMADLVVRMVRTQIVAIMGNVLLAAPVALLIFYGVQWVWGTPLLTTEKAAHLMHDLNPWQSLALVHAVIAGACLFLAGAASAFFDNHCVYSRLPQRVATLPWLVAVAGPKRAKRLAGYFENNLGALAGNFILGFLLGGVGFIGFLTGLPIDVRHVTLSAANSAFAVGAFDFNLPWQMFFWTIAGVALVGATNLIVSFSLSLSTAIKARGAQSARTRLLWRLLLKRAVKRPQDFVWPPKE